MYEKTMYRGMIFFLIAIIVTLTLVMGITNITQDKIQINIYQNFKEEYDKCQQLNNQLNNQLEELQKTKSVICQCPENKSNLLTGVGGMFIGALGVSYFILFGYPLFKKKLEDKNQPKKKKSKRKLNWKEKKP